MPSKGAFLELPYNAMLLMLDQLALHDNFFLYLVGI